MQVQQGQVQVQLVQERLVQERPVQERLAQPAAPPGEVRCSCSAQVVSSEDDREVLQEGHRGQLHVDRPLPGWRPAPPSS